MRLNEILYGFSVKSIENIPEAGGKLYIAEHVKTGARLAYLDRIDTNKSFAIAFPTIPEDDTGVFHIIEHSVLCGSENFPVKEPFVELLKGSLNTFLNALTYEDRTVYPVSSRCDKDFYNLTKVYLDAVFKPLMLKSPSVFRQEGWHAELQGDGSHKINGVVYNEMKGAYSSPDELAASELSRLLFPSGPYSKDSGGNPEKIPSLSYESFVGFYKKYYHPSNAYIYLDGSVRLDEILPLIDSYLSEYERCDISPSFESELAKGLRSSTVKFAVSEDADSKPLFLLGSLFSDFSNPTELLATKILTSTLTDSNESPLKKAILDKGLAEEVSIYTNTSRYQTVIIELRGVEEKRRDEISSAVESVIRSIANDGIDRSSLLATINRTEFKLRESDYGSLPHGVANALSIFGTWIYGGEPHDAFKFEDALREIRAKLDTDYFEKLLLSATVDSPSRANVLAIPDADGNARREREEKERIDSLVSSLTKEEYQALLDETKKMQEAQEREEGQEALSKIPVLELSDISALPDEIRTRDFTVSGARFLHHDIKTDGIMYTNLHFNASDLKEDELVLLTVLTASLTNLPTESYSVLGLRTAIKENLGSFGVSPTAYNILSEKDGAGASLVVSVSVLESKKRSLISLLSEVLCKTRYDSRELFKKTVFQLRSVCEDTLSSSAETLAFSSCRAMICKSGAINEYISGLKSFGYIKNLADNFNEAWEGELRKLSDLAKRLFVKERLVGSVSGECEDEFFAALANIFPSGSTAPKMSSVLPLKSEGVGIPTGAGVAHTALGLLLPEARDMLGALRVVRSILSYEFLWNEVRVRGGAYGTGFGARRNGALEFYSFRDPSPQKTLECYRRCADYLRAVARSGDDLTRFIIGAVGDYDLLTTPRSASAQAAADVITGWRREDEIKLREGILKTAREDLLKAADIIEKASLSSALAVAAPKDTLKKIDKIVKVERA